MNEIETWAYIDDGGNVALFGSEPHVCPDEVHLKKVYVAEWPFAMEEENLAATERTIGTYWTIPADHEIAKYVVEHGVEVGR